MLLTVSWPANRPSTSTANGQRRARPRLPVAAAATSCGSVVGRASPPGGTVASHGTSQAALRCRAAPPGVVVAAWRERPQRHRRRGAASRTGRRAQWSLPTICSTACTQQRLEHREAVLHPAARAGQVDDQAAAGDAGEATGEHGGRDALARRRRRGSPRRCRAPRGPAAAGSPRACGRSGSGRCRRWSARRGRRRRRPRAIASPTGVAVGYDDRVAPTSKPSAVRNSTMQRAGRVGVDAGRGAVRGDDDGRRARGLTGVTAPSRRTCRRSWSRPGRR